MIRALYTAASGMSAQQANLDTVANNLANSATAGFRRMRLQFEDMVYQNLITPGSPASQSTVSAGLQIGLGTRASATEVIQAQGDFNQTGESAGSGDPGRRVLPGADAGWNDGLYAGGQLPHEQPGDDGDGGRRTAAAGDHGSGERDER